MWKANTHSSKSFLSEEQSKDTERKTDLKTIFYYLRKNTATMSMVSYATGIPQKSITRYKRDLEKAGQLYELVKDKCKITGYRAWYVTTNPDLFPEDYQLKHH